MVGGGCGGFKDNNPAVEASGNTGSQTGNVPLNHPFCLNVGCHAGKEFNPNPPVESQRQWLLANGEALGEWTERGIHAVNDTDNPLPATMSCYQCHAQTCDNCHLNDFQVHASGPEPPIFPEGASGQVDKDCAQGCHAWVKAGETITSEGFTNASGDPQQTTYVGPISPAELLEAAKTDKPLHAEIFATYGCEGFCHGGPQAPHGTITLCKSCHSFQFSNAEEVNLHSTHVSFVEAEQPLADPAGAEAGSPACNYCHSSGASCWNCHLSGHDPVTRYWELPAQ